MTMKRYLRLLPSVMLVCGGLLVLKGAGIVHEAMAGPGQPAGTDAMAPPPAPANHDFANEDGEIATAAQVDVLTSLSKRRGELDTREAQIQVETKMLAATESRVDTKIAQLKQLQAQITALLTQRDAAQQQQIDSLVKTYSTMKAKDAARIFDSLDDKVLVPVAEKMKSDVLAPVLAAMNADAAQKLTMKLANKLTLPDATSALSPMANPGTAQAAPGASAIPGAPQTQAAATPAAAPAPGAAPAAAPKTGG
jgi:flagellar motility protein MotE (MotC chaperone)